MSLDAQGLLNALAAYQQNGSATDPNLLSQLNNISTQMHLPLNTQTIQFLTDVADSEIASGKTGLLNGWGLPAGADSRHEFFDLLGSAETFAASTGWAKFPTPTQLQWGVEHGVANMDQNEQFAWMAGMAGIDKTKMPWAYVGQTKTQWDTNTQSFGDIWESYTGNRSVDPNVLSTAMQQRWTSSHFQQYVLSDPTVQKQYGWVKYGMTYQDFQTHKQQNVAAATQRFGNNPTDAQYVQDLGAPLSKVAEAPVTVQQGPSPQQQPHLMAPGGYQTNLMGGRA